MTNENKGLPKLDNKPEPTSRLEKGAKAPKSTSNQANKIPNKDKKNKNEPNRTKVTKRRKRWRRFNKIINIIMLLGVLSCVIMAVLVLIKYKETLNFEKNDPKFSLASQSLDLLYDDNPESKKNKIAFIKLHDSMVTKGGELTSESTKANVHQLKKLLDNIDLKSSEEDYQGMYATVAMKYSLQKQYNNMFKDKSHTVLKPNVTPATVANLTNKTFDDLKILFVMNPDDEFVIRYIEEQEKFVHDVEVFNHLIDVFNQGILIEGNTVTLQNNYRDDISVLFREAQRDLDYDWESTQYMEKVTKLIQPIVDDLNEDWVAYGKYETDMANKDIAYQNWNYEKQVFYDEVNAIREQAIAEKRAKEEAERLAKELEERKPLAIKEVEALTDLTNNQINIYKNAINNANSVQEIESILSQAREQDKKARDEKNKPTEDSISSSSSSSTDKETVDSETKDSSEETISSNNN